MKLIIFASLFLAQSVLAAEMSSEKMASIVEDVKSFKASCLDAIKVNDVKEISIKNKTTESIDNTAFINAVNKDLGLKLTPGSKNTLAVDLLSTAKEKDGIRTTNYKLNLVLNDSTKDVCKNTYGKEYKEKR